MIIDTTIKRPFMIYDGKVYRRGMFVSSPTFAKSYDPSRAIDEREFVTGHEMCLEIYDKPFIKAIRVTHYTVTMRPSGRYVYEMFGREEERRYVG